MTTTLTPRQINRGLIHALDAGYIKIISLLLEKGADVNAQDKAGYTPLHFACYGGHPDLARLLLEAGADVNVKDKDGHIAANLAVGLPIDNPSREEILGLFCQYAPEAVMEAYCMQPQTTTTIKGA